MNTDFDQLIQDVCRKLNGLREEAMWRLIRRNVKNCPSHYFDAYRAVLEMGCSVIIRVNPNGDEAVMHNGPEPQIGECADNRIRDREPLPGTRDLWK